MAKIPQPCRGLYFAIEENSRNIRLSVGITIFITGADGVEFSMQIYVPILIYSFNGYAADLRKRLDDLYLAHVRLLDHTGRCKYANGMRCGEVSIDSSLRVYLLGKMPSTKH